MPKKKANSPVKNKQHSKHLRRNLVGAAILCLAILGSLYAVNRSRHRAVVNASEADTSCAAGISSAHAAHAGNSTNEAESIGVLEAPEINTASAPGPAPDGMVWIPGGEFSMGSEDPEMHDARPFHRVALDGYWMDQTEVTNE
ncbi:MAG TPA: SUMF1/EgtB/PvdO family nonheme iron enzyme, partial [Pyrinomonadaceae bacterium]|nr:SUMF1/EgtB/PvdO family nonheme iron enzyme [Pyrinomonadaceae bacterium]